ncbi:MAG: hypothetical protein ACYCS9_08540 [Candidatus Dormibacteria bacterium]
MLPRTHVPRLYLALLGLICFGIALGLSWGLGAGHLWVQGVAMVMALVAFWLAAMAARG